jgi:hypothetical protein
MYSPGDCRIRLAASLPVAATVGVAIALGVSGSKRRALDERRGRQQAMTDVHLRLTTGEVAQARHVVGDLMAATGSEAANRIRQSPGEYISAYYTLVWALESIDNSRRIWILGLHDGQRSTFLKWNEDELKASLPRLRQMLISAVPGFEQSSQDAWDSLTQIISERAARTVPPGAH